MKSGRYRARPLALAGRPYLGLGSGVLVALHGLYGVLVKLQGKDVEVVTIKADSVEELRDKINKTTDRLHAHKVDFSVHYEGGKPVHTAQVIADKKKLLLEG